MNPEWIAALAAIAAVIVSIIALVSSFKRADQDKIDANIEAIMKQMRALELDVARNYVMKTQMDQEIGALGQRLESLINNVAREVAELNRWLRKAPP